MAFAQIYVPTAVDSGVHNHVKHTLSEHYGGYTQIPAHGGWFDEKEDELIEETVEAYMVVAPSTVDGGKMYARMVSLARDVSDMSDEEEVLAYVHDGGGGETITVN